MDERLGANEEAEEGEKVENEAEGGDEAEDEGEGELEDEGEDDEAEDEDEDEEQLRPLSPATAAALRKRIRSLPKLRMRNSSQYMKVLKLQTLLSNSRAEGGRDSERARTGWRKPRDRQGARTTSRMERRRLWRLGCVAPCGCGVRLKRKQRDSARARRRVVAFFLNFIFCN